MLPQACFNHYIIKLVKFYKFSFKINFRPIHVFLYITIRIFWFLRITLFMIKGIQGINQRGKKRYQTLQGYVYGSNGWRKTRSKPSRVSKCTPMYTKSSHEHVELITTISWSIFFYGIRVRKSVGGVRIREPGKEIWFLG